MRLEIRRTDCSRQSRKRARAVFALFKKNRKRLDGAMKTIVVCLTIIALFGPVAVVQSPLELQPNDNLHAVLERQVGKPVELRLKSGEKIAGKLQKVTGTLAHVAQLSDASFYDAAVEIESVAALVVKARSN